MIDMDKVEKLRAKTGISYEEAKAILTETDGDILDAFILLEQRGKVAPEQETAKANTSQYQSEYTEAEYTTAESASSYQKKVRSEDSVSFGELVGRFFKWCGRIINRGNQNSLHVSRGDEEILSTPVTILVILLLLAFWIVFPLLIIGLFCGFRYHFTGPDLGTDRVNRTMNTVSDSARQAVYNVKEATGEFSHDVKKGAADPDTTVNSQDNANEENNTTR